MRRFWAWLGLQSGKRAGWVTLIGVLVTVALGLGITQLKFTTGTESYLNKSDSAYKNDVRYERTFGGQALVTMFTMEPGHTVTELFDPVNLATMKSVEAKLTARTDLISAVVSPRVAVEFSNSLVSGANGIADSVATQALLGATGRDNDAASKAARGADTSETLKRFGAVTGPHTLANPQWVDFLLYNNQGRVRAALRTFFIDTTHAQMIVRLHGNQPIADQAASTVFVAGVVKAAHFHYTTTVTTGSPALLKNINDYLQGGMFALGGVAAAIMVLILVLLFGVRWRLLPLAVVLLGVLWAFGLAGYLHIPLTLATIAGLPTLLGIGIDYAIQMHARVEEEVIINRNPHPIQDTARNLCPALLVVTFDAIFAFLALQFAKVPMIRQFGLLLAIGIAVICLCSIIAPLATLGMREYKSPTKGRDPRDNALARIVVKLGGIPARAAIPLTVASLLVFFAGVAVEGRLVLQTDPIQWVNPHSKVIHDIHALEAGTGSANEMGAFFRTKSVFSDATVSYIDHFTVTELQRHPQQLATASSMVEVMSDLINDVPGVHHVSPTGADVRAAYGVAPPAIRFQTVSMATGAQNVIFRTATPNLQKVKGVVDEIRTLSTPKPDVPALVPTAGITVVPSGLAVVGVGLLENLESNRILLTYLSILFVGIFLAFRMRSIIRSLLSLVPVLIAAGVASLVAFAFSLKLSPMTAVGGPLVVAACTEFTSLILLRFVEERAKGLDPKHAMDVTAARTGRAFIVSAATAVSGIAVLSFSSMPLLRGFGIIVGMNVAIALLAALTILPPMLVWADQPQRNWVSHGMVDRLRHAIERERIEIAGTDKELAPI